VPPELATVRFPVRKIGDLNFRFGSAAIRGHPRPNGCCPSLT
jgi:hypothetical protein